MAATTPYKKIILTADDYGAIDFIDTGILNALSDRNINCVSAFVCFYDSKKRMETLVQKQNEVKADHKVGIGLHFSLTTGEPITRSDATGLVSHNGRFLSPRKYPFKRVTKAIGQFEAELRAQIELLGRWLGGVENIDHISNHHGVVYVDDDLFKVYARVVAEYKIPMRSPLVWSKAKLPFINAYPILTPPGMRPFNPLTRYGIRELQWVWEVFEAVNYRRRVRIAEQLSIPTPFCNNDCIYGLAFKENIERMLDQYVDRDMATEFMFHLGEADLPEGHHYDKISAPEGIDNRYFPTRKEESDLLRNMPLKDVLKARSIDPIVYRDL